MESDTDREEFEHIPWASLAAETRDPWVRWLGIGVGVVVAIVLGMAVARVIGGSRDATVVVPGDGAAPVAAAPVSETPVTDVSTTVAAPTTVAEAPRLYSEADLVVGEADVMAAIAPFDVLRMTTQAEWFVTDFFTMDGDPAGVRDARAMLPRDAAVTWPDPSDGGVSYVEWARSVSVEPVGEGRFEVVVLFRVLAGPGRVSLQRQEVRAVSVLVAVDDAGSVSVADLPEPVPVPPSSRVAASWGAAVDPPPEVATAAIAAAAERWEMEATVVAATLDEGEWRVEVAGTDWSGLQWPLVVRLPVDS